MAWYYITRCKRPLDIVIAKLNDKHQQKFYPTSLSSSNKCCFIPSLRFETIAAKSGGETVQGKRLMSLRRSDTTKSVRSHQTIECAQCGEALYLPEWSEYRHKNSVRHLWKCEACDHAFETTVSYESLAA